MSDFRQQYLLTPILKRYNLYGVKHHQVVTYYYSRHNSPIVIHRLILDIPTTGPH